MMDNLLYPSPTQQPPSTHLTFLLTPLLTILLPLTTFLYIHADYKLFLSLGPGGTPSTPLGYLKIKLLSLVSLRDPLRPLPIPPHFRPQKGYLNPLTVPHRTGPRPLVQGIAPQRQKTQISTRETYTHLVHSLRALAQDPTNRLIERTSCFEKHSSGLFSTVPITRTCGGEICHAHPSDGSMHLTLHPADVKVLVEKGWGERHPLARGGWFRRFVPREFVLVYAGKGVEEVETVMGFVKASVWWVGGVDVEGKEGRDREGKVVEGVEGAGSECWACRARGCGGRAVEGLVDDA